MTAPTIERDVPAPETLRGHLLALARIAWPTIISRAGILTMAIVDVAMVARYDTDELAYASLGTALFVPLLVSGVGLMIGVIALVSQRFGAGDEAECGAIWYRALPWAFVVGSIGMLVCLQGEAILALFGQTPEMAREGGAVAVALAPGVFGYAFFTASTFFLEGIKRPGPGMIAMLVANILNLALNWVFIYGNLGAPAMGAVGSGITTSIVRVFLGIALVIYVLRMADRGRFGIGGLGLSRFAGWWSGGRALRRIGYAAGTSIGAETSAHSAMVQLAGLLGVVPVGAYSIAYNIEATMFMVALGVGTATGVLVGNAWGRRAWGETRAAGWIGLGATLGVMAVCGLLITLFARPLSAAYTPDPQLVTATVPLLPLVALVILADGANMTMAQAVRATGDTWNSTIRYLIGFWLVMVPLGWWLGIELGYGASGLLVAVLIGCSVAFVLQAMRFRALVHARREG